MALPQVGNQLILQGLDPFLRGMDQARRSQDALTAALNRTSPASVTAGQGLSSFSQVAIGAMRRVGELAVNALVSLGSALLDVGRQAIDNFAVYERLGIALQTLVAREMVHTGTATDMAAAQAAAGVSAQELIGWIQKLAIESPFTMDDVAAAFRLAVAYGFAADSALSLVEQQKKGIVTAQRLTQVLIDFAAGSGASGVQMERIALALGQIKAEGKLAGTEVRQLAQAGVPVDQILARAMKTTTANVMDLRQKGLIPANLAIRAITESLEKDFGGAAKRQAKTFSGLLTALQDIKDVGLREFFTGTFRAIQPYLDRFVTSLSDPTTLAGIRAIGDTLGEAAADVLHFFDQIWRGRTSLDNLQASLGATHADLGRFIGGIQGVIDNVRAGFEQGGRVEAFARGLSSMVFVIRNFFDQWLRGNTILEDLQATVGATHADLGRFIGSIQGVIGNFRAGFEQGGLVEAFARGLSSLIFVIRDRGPAIFEALLGENGILPIATLQARARGLFLQFAQAAIAALPEVLAGLTVFGLAILDWLSTHLPAMLQDRVEFQQALGNMVLLALPAVLDGLAALLQGLIGGIAERLPDLIAVLARLALEMAVWIVAALPGLIDNLGRFLNTLLNWIVDSLPGWASELSKLGGQLAGWVLNALPGLLANLGTAAGKLVSWVLQTIIDLAPKLLELAAAFINWIAVSVIPNLPAALLAILNALIVGIGSFIVEIGPELIEMARMFYLWVYDPEGPIAHIGEALLALFTAISDYIVQAKADVFTWMLAVGTSIVDGLKKGITDAWEGIKAWFNGLIQGLIDAALNFLQGGSPSRRTARELGQPFGQGMALGILETLPLLADATRSALTGAIEGAYSIMPPVSSAGGSPVNNTYHYTSYGPSYTMPVTTMAGANQVGRSFALMEILAG